ncbi:MAG: acyl carrier protein [Clostridia bacterium]|nr:acyl carrier protein [Clostridia bacterium]
MMSREQIFEEIKGALVEVLGLEDDSNIKEEDNIVDNLGADSLDFVELIMKLENIFNVKIEDEDVEKIITVEDLVNYIESIL